MYRAGILSTEELARLHKDSTSAVMVIDDIANQRSIDKLYSVKAGICLPAYGRHHTLSSEDPAVFPQRISLPTSPTMPGGQRPPRKKILDNYSWGKRHRTERAENHRPRRDSEPGNPQYPRKPAKESIQRSESIGQKQLMLAGRFCTSASHIVLHALSRPLPQRLLQPRKRQPLRCFFTPHHVLLW